MLPEYVTVTAAPLALPLQADIAMPAAAGLTASGERRPYRLSREKPMRRLLRCSMAFGLLTFAAHTGTAPLLSGVGQLTCDQVASDSQKSGIPGELAKNTYMAWAQGDPTALHVMQSQSKRP